MCEGRALFFIPATWAPRQLLFRVVTHPITELTVLAAVVINCVMLTLDNPSVVEGSSLRHALDTADLVFAVVFAVEMGAKMVALGAWGCGHRCGPGKGAPATCVQSWSSD